MTKLSGIVSLLILFLLASCLDDELKKVSITKEEIFRSEIIKDDYSLYFYLPPGYTVNKKYPVIFLLDGDWHTERMANEISVMVSRDEIPECILVGIGNSENRFRDYSYPPEADTKNSGEGDKYYAFLKDELIPYIDDNFSTDTTSRILAGHSLGGYFVLYALMQTENGHPLFSGYISVSPSAFWSDGYIFNLEEEIATKINDLDCSLYMGVGADEGLTMNILAREIYERRGN